MRWSCAGALALVQIAVVAAYPGEQIFKRDCARDNCLRAIAGTNGPTAVRTSDCKSFQTTTTAQCTSVVLATTTVFASTVTTTGTVTSTSTQTDVITERSTETQVSITTATSTTIIPETSVSVSTTTVTTIYDYNPAAVGKREAQQPLCGVAPASHVPPSYASVCSGAVRYASACSCAGIPASTVVQATVTSTSTVTVTSTPTVGTEVTATATSVTETTTTTSTTTQTSTTTTEGYSTTSTTTTTTTLQATPTITNKFVIYAKIGNSDTYLERDPSDPTGAIFSPLTLQNAKSYTLGTDHQLTLFDSDIAVTMQSAKKNPVGFVSMSSPDFVGAFVIKCTAATSKAANGGYPLTCQSPDTTAPYPALLGNAWSFNSAQPSTPFPQLYAFSPYNAPATGGG